METYTPIDKGIQNQGIIEEKGDEADVSKIIEDVKNHPFEFGYRYPLENGKATLTWSFGRLWLNYNLAETTDDIWYGNCADDARLTYQELTKKLPKEAKFSIWEREASHFNEFYDSIQHFSVFAEIPKNDTHKTVIADIDHSSFYKDILNMNEKSITAWEVKPERIITKNEKTSARPIDDFFEISEHTLGNGENIMLFGKIKKQLGELRITIKMMIGKKDSKDITLTDNIKALNQGLLYKRTEENQALMTDNTDSLIAQGLTPETMKLIRDTLLFITSKIPKEKRFLNS